MSPVDLEPRWEEPKEANKRNKGTEARALVQCVHMLREARTLTIPTVDDPIPALILYRFLFYVSNAPGRVQAVFLRISIPALFRRMQNILLIRSPASHSDHKS